MQAACSRFTVPNGHEQTQLAARSQGWAPNCNFITPGNLTLRRHS